jgi:hypothetical protein
MISFIFWERTHVTGPYKCRRLARDYILPAGLDTDN